MNRYTLEFGSGMRKDPDGEWVRWDDVFQLTVTAAEQAVKMDEFKKILDCIVILLKDAPGIDIQ